MRLSSDIFFYQGTPFSEKVLNSNTIIINGSDLLIIDPGQRAHWPALKKQIEDDGLDPARIKMIIYTHCHPDHMDAGQLLVEQYGARQAMHRLETKFLAGDGRYFFQWMNLPHPQGPFQLLEEGPFSFHGKDFHLLLTPGHTPGGITLHWPGGRLLAPGDLFFPGARGADNFAGGKPEAMDASLRRLRDLAGVELILCGHGAEISGEKNIKDNYSLFGDGAIHSLEGFVGHED